MKTIVKTILFAAIISTTQVQSQTDDALKINDNGNVGINTATPTEKLDVNGNLKVSGNITVISEVKASTINATGTIQQNGNDLLPKGAIIMWYGGTTAPAGWSICNGTNGTPDLRGRFIVGVGQSNGSGTNYSLSAIGGEEKVTLNVEQLPSHTHNLNNPNNNKLMSTKAYERVKDSGVGASHSLYDTGGDKTDYFLKDQVSIGNTGSGQPHENRPPYYALYYIMKL